MKIIVGCGPVEADAPFEDVPESPARKMEIERNLKALFRGTKNVTFNGIKPLGKRGDFTVDWNYALPKASMDQFKELFGPDVEDKVQKDAHSFFDTLDYIDRGAVKTIRALLRQIRDRYDLGLYTFQIVDGKGPGVSVRILAEI